MTIYYALNTLHEVISGRSIVFATFESVKTAWKWCVSLRLNSLTLGTLDLGARAILQLSLWHWGTVCMAAFRSRGLPNLSIRRYFDLLWKHVTACARRDSCRSHPATSIGDDSLALSWQRCGQFHRNYVFQGEGETNHSTIVARKWSSETCRWTLTRSNAFGDNRNAVWRVVVILLYVD